MLWLSCGRTLLDKIPNTTVMNELGVMSIIDKLRERRLCWFGHVHRKQPSVVVRRVEMITLEGAKSRGQPRRKWENSVMLDLKELTLTKDMAYDKRE